MAVITEDQLEQVTIGWFKELGYAYVFAPELAPDGSTPERHDFRQVILTGRLQAASDRGNTIGWGDCYELEEVRA